MGKSNIALKKKKDKSICSSVTDLIVFLCILNLFLINFSAFAQRISIPVAQADSRFTFTAERTGLSFGSESYYFYVQNNTDREYKIVVNVELDTYCQGSTNFNLHVNGVIHLKPYEKFTPSSDYVHNRSGNKDCAISEGKSLRIFKNLRYSISNVIDVSKEKEDVIAKKKAEDDAKMKAKADADNKAKTDQQQLEQPKAVVNKTNNEQVLKNTIVTKSNTTGINNTGLSEKVKVNGQYVQVFRQNGVPYIKNADGTYHQTTEEAYSQILNVSDKKTQTPNTQEIQKKQNDTQALKFAQDYARNQQYQTERTEIITKGVTDLGNLVGGWIQQNQADKARKEALQEQRAEEERQRQYALYLKTSNRKNAFNNLPAKDIPLSSQEKATSIYFFIYAYNNLDSEYGATAYISNVFEIGKYNDGTRAYTATVKNDIANLTSYNEVLHGYYYTAQEAEQIKQELINILQSNGVSVNTIFYKGKAATANTSNISPERQESNYGTMIGAPAKVDMRPMNGTAPNSQVDKFKESQSKNYGTIIK